MEVARLMGLLRTHVSEWKDAISRVGLSVTSVQYYRGATAVVQCEGALV